MRVQEIEPKAQRSSLQRLEEGRDEALIVRLRQVESELADRVARSLVVEPPESGLKTFYTLVVARRRAVEAEIHSTVTP